MEKLTHRTCSVDGCERQRVARGYCSGHYQRWKKGRALTPPLQASVSRDKNCTVEGCGKPHAARGYCAMHYSRLRRGQDLHAPSVYALNVTQRFWRSVEQRSPKECWHWRGARTKDGYGNFWTGDRSDRAHRFAYQLAKGPIPEGLIVCHSCDEPSCVNPNHLWVGTHADNSDDKLAKGRDNPPRGSRNRHAKLTKHQVVEIRRLYAAGRHTQDALAAKFGITQASVWAIVQRRTWSHVD